MGDVSSAPIDRTPLAAPRRRGFLSRTQEGDALPTVHGRLPDWLRGTHLLDGPALWDLPHGQFRHWFDGLGQLHALHLDGATNSARYRSRFLNSEAYRRSRASGTPVLGGYGTSGGRSLLARLLTLLNPPRTDNACVVMSRIGGQWVTSTESDRMHRFDPQTLASQGEWIWRDDMKLPLAAAHANVDARGTWWNVGIEFGRHNRYRLFRAGTDGRREIVASIPVQRPGYLHAFALSARHAVVWECALRASVLRFLFSDEPYVDHFDWLPQQGSRIHAISLADGRVRSWDTAPLFAFHATQAFERGTDIVLDLCVTSPAVNDALFINRLRTQPVDASLLAQHRRFVLADGATSARTEELPGRFDLPRGDDAHGAQRELQCVFAATVDEHTPGEFFNRTLKVSLRSGSLQRWGRETAAIALEPLFVPRPGRADERDDDGVLLVPTLADHDAGTVIAVLEAATLDERARIALPHVVPFGFHAAWHAG